MGLKEKIEKLLASQRTAEMSRAVAAQDLAYMGEALSHVADVLHEAQESIPGSSFTEPGRNPRDPDFYVTSLRIPKRPAMHFDNAMRFYIIGFPEPPDGIQLVKAVVIGDAGQMMGPSRFLQTWHAAKTGGVVFYSGAAEGAQVKTSTEQTLLRLLERRSELSSSYLSRGQGNVGIWPVDPNLRPRLCPRCYIPLPKGSSCVRCRNWNQRWSANEAR